MLENETNRIFQPRINRHKKITKKKDFLKFSFNGFNIRMEMTGKNQLT